MGLLVGQLGNKGGESLLVFSGTVNHTGPTERPLDRISTLSLLCMRYNGKWENYIFYYQIVFYNAHYLTVSLLYYDIGAEVMIFDFEILEVSKLKNEKRKAGLYAAIIA